MPGAVLAVHSGSAGRFGLRLDDPAQTVVEIPGEYVSLFHMQNGEVGTGTKNGIVTLGGSSTRSSTRGHHLDAAGTFGGLAAAIWYSVLIILQHSALHSRTSSQILFFTQFLLFNPISGSVALTGDMPGISKANFALGVSGDQNCG